MRILFVGHYWKDYRAFFHDRLGDRHELVFFGRTADPGMAEEASRAHVIVSSVLPPELGRAARELRLVHSSGAGVEKIDMASVGDGIPLCRTFHHGPSIAEHVVMAMLALQRQVFRMDRELRAGRWLNPGIDPAVPFSATLEGKVVLVLGTGEIGAHVAHRCRPFGTRVVGVNRSGAAPGAEGFHEVAPLDALDTLLPRADFVVVGLPLTPATRGILDGRRLGLMKPTAFLVNVARGPIVEEAALFDALEARHIAGAAIDVWYEYPKDPGTPTRPSALPFDRLDNVIMTPHASGNTTATFARRAEDIADNIERFERGEPLRNLVVGGER